MLIPVERDSPLLTGNRHEEMGKPVVVNVNVMSSIIPSGMLSGHTLRNCFDEIMI